MKCTNCYYGEIRYNKDGQKIGVDCTRDNMRFIDIDIADIMSCGAWAESED